MAFCTHCGSQLILNAKFCPSCGGNISMSNKTPKKDSHSAYHEIMHKRVPKSIKDKVKNSITEKTKDFVKEKTQEFVEESFSNSNNNEISTETNQNTPTTDLDKERSKKVKRWMLFYILFNIPLFLINNGDDEVTGVLIFSAAVLVGYLIYALQKKKEKPYALGLKIVLVLQSLLAISGIMSYLDGSNESALVAVISFALLVFLNVKIIFRRNK